MIGSFVCTDKTCPRIGFPGDEQVGAPMPLSRCPLLSWVLFPERRVLISFQGSLAFSSGVADGDRRATIPHTIPQFGVVPHPHRPSQSQPHQALTSESTRSIPS